MKRYAAHFIFIPGCGYFKQCMVEVEQDNVMSVFPLTEEIEGVEWFPGVIALLDKRNAAVEWDNVFPKQADILREFPLPFGKGRFLQGLVPYLFYPFDFTSMQPVAGTRHRQLL